MKNLLPPINTPDNLFHDGNPLTGELGTLVTAEWLNDYQGATRDLQSELLNILAEANINPDSSVLQLLTAIRALTLSRSNPFGDIKNDGAAAISKALENLGLGELAKTPRFLVSKGQNANGWYEIYSDGFKRVGKMWDRSNPFLISTPATGARVNYPISFTTQFYGIYVTENGNTNNNFEFANPAQIGMTGFSMATMDITLGSSPSTAYGTSFTGYYTAEGY